MDTADKRVCVATVTVYVVAENRLLRETLVRLFRKRSDVLVVGTSCCSDLAAAHIVEANCAVLLLDCFNPNHKAEAFIATMRESAPDVKILLFGMDEDPIIFLRAVRLGVDGYMLKNASAAELLDAVRLVAQGQAVCPPKFCKVLFQVVASDVANPGPVARFELTQRQRQLMSLVAMGLSNKEIAANLNLSEFTVKNHIYRVMKQVDAQDRHEAAHLIHQDRVSPASSD